MKIERLTPGRLAAFRRLVERAWRWRPRSDAYYRWRYSEAPGLTTLVAVRGDECVATISAFERCYLDGGRLIVCLEPFDWYTLPEARPSGVGLRLMKQLQNSGMPALGVGGTEHTLRLLPRLGWTTVGAAVQYVQPLSASYILRNRRLPALARTLALPLIDRVAAAWFSPPACPSPFEAHRVALGDPRLAPLQDCGATFTSLLDSPFLEWLERGSAFGAGRYFALLVSAGGEALAWSLGRLFRWQGLMRGTILDVRLREADERAAVAAVLAMARLLARSGADAVAGSTTAPLLCAAFRRAGFRETREQAPAMVWQAGEQLALDRLAAGCLADAAFLPLHSAAPDIETSPDEAPACPLSPLVPVRVYAKKGAVAGGG